MSDISLCDISHWNGKIGFEKFKAAGISGVIAKAGEIPTSSKKPFYDDMFSRNMREAKEYGLISGAYYFFHPSIGAPEQARHFQKCIEAAGITPDLPLVADVETTDGGMKSYDCARVLKLFLDLVECFDGRKPIIYSRWGMLYNEYGNPDWLETTSDDGYKLWLAQYNNELTRKPADMRNVIMWQFSEKYRIPGIGVNLDCDKWLKTEAELLALAGMMIEEPVGKEVPEPVVSEAYKRALELWTRTHSEDGMPLWDKMTSMWGALRNL